MGAVELTSCGNIFKCWRNCKKIHNEAWITGIQDDADVDGALKLAHSLRQYRTRRTIAAVFVQDVSNQESKLRQCFDAVFLLDNAFLRSAQIPLEMKIKIFAISLPVYKKCVFVGANYTVNETSDSVFDEGFKFGPFGQMTFYSQLKAGIIMSTAEQRSQEEIKKLFQKEWKQSTPWNDMLLPLRTYCLPEKLKEQFSLPVRETKPQKWALVGAQDYYKIRKECLQRGKWFEDSDFPAENSSLFTSPHIQGKIEMKRPKEFCSVPQFFVAGTSRFDVIQGQLGDCWYLASAASLTLNAEMFSKVVPEDNTFETGKYCGAFHFRFWKDGEWVDVVVDDRLPTQRNELIYMKSEQKNEFWGALLEKAYAKLHGSYHNLKGGMSNEAFINFVGGINEMYKTSDSPPNMFEILERAEKHHSFLSCSTGSFTCYEEGRTGLVGNHMYSITKTCVIPQPENPLLRLRNPVGSGEWKGAWSDGSEEWNAVSEKLRNELGLTMKPEGEFWMSFGDVLKHFRTLEICHWSADGLGRGDGEKQRWHCHMYEGKWIRGVTAGGYPQGMYEKEREKYPLESFASNPQYVGSLVNIDKNGARNKCTLLVALLQKTSRNKGSKDYLSIGFRVYALPKPETEQRPLPPQFFLSHKPVAEEPAFRRTRQICLYFSLDPGTYVIVPCTEMPNAEGEFLLRVFTESGAERSESEGEIPILDMETTLVCSDREEKRQIQKIFGKVAGKSEEVEWTGLKTILDSVIKDAYKLEDNQGYRFISFPSDVCRSLVILGDADQGGKLKFNDVLHIYKCVSTWTRKFKVYDQDSNCHLKGYELRNVFAAMGYGVDKKMQQIIGVRHGDENGNISFEEFIKSAVKLKVVWDLEFQLANYSNSNKEIESNTPTADSNNDEWYYSMLYL